MAYRPKIKTNANGDLQDLPIDAETLQGQTPSEISSHIYDKIKSELIDAKADKTDLNSHIENKSNPHSVTKAQVGLGNVGNFKAVSTVANQGLTDTEKSNARSNIGAGTSSFSGSYNDLSNKPTIPTVNNGTLTIQKNGTNVGIFTANQSSNSVVNITVPTVYAGSSTAGGSATSAVKLDTTTAGSATQPVYFSGGKPVATTYSLNKTVPSNAVFTDTTYGVATTSTLGLIKSGGDITVDSSGIVSVKDDSHEHTRLEKLTITDGMLRVNSDSLDPNGEDKLYQPDDVISGGEDDIDAFYYNTGITSYDIDTGSSYKYSFPPKTGTFALTSDLQFYIHQLDIWLYDSSDSCYFSLTIKIRNSTAITNIGSLKQYACSIDGGYYYSYTGSGYTIDDGYISPRAISHLRITPDNTMYAVAGGEYGVNQARFDSGTYTFTISDRVTKI